MFIYFDALQHNLHYVASKVGHGIVIKGTDTLTSKLNLIQSGQLVPIPDV